jgi:hypothetical protein
MFRTFGQIAGIGGLALGVLLVLFREVIRKAAFSKVNAEHAYKIIRLIIVLTWTVALVGIGAWVYGSGSKSETLTGPPVTFAPAFPFDTGWIFVGYYGGTSWTEGPYATVAFRPTGGERGKIVPDKGDILRVRADRHVRIVDFQTEGAKNMMTSPPEAHVGLPDSDKTGITLQENQLVLTRDVTITSSPGGTPAIWARVAPCNAQIDACQNAKSEAQ